MGGGDQTRIPIVDIDIWTDPSGDIHDRFRPFSLRDRLAPSGDPEQAPGFQIWTRDPGDVSIVEALGNAVSGASLGGDAVALVDEWLTALAADRSGDPLEVVLRRTRPGDAVDSCLPEGADEPETGVDVYERPGPCRDDYPISGDPRTAAGGPRSGHVVKCSLKPVDPADYEVPVTAAQLERIEEIFPQGVCDWEEPSVGETVPVTPDRSYEDVVTPQQSA